MHLNHIGLTAPSEDQADRFFFTLLGCEKLNAWTVPAEITSQLFHVDQPLTVINYRHGPIRFEVFIDPKPTADPTRLSHLCLEVPDRGALLDQAAKSGYPIRRAVREGREVIFLGDEAGYLYEIKEIPRS